MLRVVLHTCVLRCQACTVYRVQVGLLLLALVPNAAIWRAEERMVRSASKRRATSAARKRRSVGGTGAEGGGGAWYKSELILSMALCELRAHDPSARFESICQVIPFPRCSGTFSIIFCKTIVEYQCVACLSFPTRAEGRYVMTHLAHAQVQRATGRGRLC